MAGKLVRSFARCGQELNNEDGKGQVRGSGPESASLTSNDFASFLVFPPLKIISVCLNEGWTILYTLSRKSWGNATTVSLLLNSSVCTHILYSMRRFTLRFCALGIPLESWQQSSAKFTANVLLTFLNKGSTQRKFMRVRCPAEFRLPLRFVSSGNADLNCIKVDSSSTPKFDPGASA